MSLTDQQAERAVHELLTAAEEGITEAAAGVFDIIIVCGFAFDGYLDNELKKLGGVTVLKAAMNPDMAMGEDLLKKTGSGNLFMVFGEPDIEVKKDGTEWVVQIHGLDVYDPTTGEIRSRSTDDIACDLVLVDLDHPTLSPIVEAAREAISLHLRSRVSERRAQVLDRWKTEHVYPYAGDPKSSAEIRERKVFDAVAVAASPAVAKEPKAARLSLRLIKEALGQPPGALHRVLKEVLDLTPDQLADFDRLLDRTTLTAIIYTSKMVTDRLDFLQELEGMLFDHGKKERLLERQQLHRVLANGRAWVFGEQYTLAVDDKGLTKVLGAHRALLGDDTPVTAPVRDAEGHTRIVDLMLSKATYSADRRQHLVVELKRPTVRLTQVELGQITNYAVAVSRDERFKTPDVTWDFWLLGDDMDDVVEELANRPNQPSGLYTEGAHYRVWVRRWAEILEENRQRLHFYREHLEYEPEEEAELQDVLGKYVTGPESRSTSPDRSAVATS